MPSQELDWELDEEAPSVLAPQSGRAAAIMAGFRINWMNMTDAETHRLYWEDSDWGDLLTERDIHIPASILQCRGVSREFQFSSVELMQSLRIEQRIFFQNSCMEEWSFNFGFVIPNSTNTWQQTIEAAAEEKMMPASLLNGNVVVETAFYDGDLLVCKCKLRVWYDK